MRVALYPFLLLFAAGLLAPGARADPVALPPHRSVILESERMGEARAINLYLPPDHGGDRRYPVVYMPDGGLDEDFPHVAGAIDAAIREGRMAPVILVGIANTQRRRDMTGPTEVEEDRAIAPVVGGSPAFRAFIASELVPWVEANLPAGEGRAIIGESLAGLFILETLFEQPDLFDTWIVLDPSLWWNAGRLARDAAGWFDTNPGVAGRLYLAWTEPDSIGPNVLRLEESMRRAAPAGLQWRVEARPDLDHGSIYRALAPVVLPMMYPGD